MKLVLALLTMPVLALAGECVLTTKTVSQSQIQISERDAVVQQVVPTVNGRQRCLVSFRARIGNQWFTAHGDHDFDHSQSASTACQLAGAKADAQVKNSVTHTSVVTDNVMVCSDQPQHQTLRTTQIGTVGYASQFRPNPERPREFRHNSTRCRWFLDHEFRHNDVMQVQGIVCHVQDGLWAVVDKF